MAKRFALAEDVEKEISRLESSPMVALARTYEEVAYLRRQKMEQLQRLEEKGIALVEAGVTWEKLSELMGDMDYAQ